MTTPKKTTRAVRFSRSFSPYASGEVAAFPPHKAKSIVDGGYGTYLNRELGAATVGTMPAPATAAAAATTADASAPAPTTKRARIEPVAGRVRPTKATKTGKAADTAEGDDAGEDEPAE